MLRGVAYAQYRQRDSNQVDITLSPPAHPSRLMEILPKQGFAWTRLYDTKDSLVELASQAQRRLVIVSPFLDSEGLQWIGQLFDATAGKSMDRILVVRGRDRLEVEALCNQESQLSSLGIKVLSYAITHDPALRSPAIETFHAKILLADNDKAYIGSANMTRWSRDFSMECGVILKGPSVKPVATLIEAIIKISNSWKGRDSANS
jgi:phosphatidylserine/phosphatidylglycerophosphate/cardiolipin synthase-like enzyme